MVTVLYLITVWVWYDLSSFEGNFQVSHCRAEKVRIEANFDVNAVCLSQSDRFLIVDKDVYRR
jgi:hypothetical protein